jgi:lysophospholipase L1-like esterase
VHFLLLVVAYARCRTGRKSYGSKGIVSRPTDVLKGNNLYVYNLIIRLTSKQMNHQMPFFKMKTLLSNAASLLLLVFVSTTLRAQQIPFYNEIQQFKKQDSISFPPKNAILLVGSSSFTKWKDVQSYFPGYTIINRGFGGSVLPDVIRYANDIIIPYHPKQVVVYCGDNDLASSDTITPQIVTNRFKQLFSIIRSKLPSANITFVSIKPSPSRYKLLSKMEQTNSMIEAFLKSEKNTSFIDVFHPMLMANGRAIPDIFLSDSLHMNEKGYAIWKKAIEPKLRK